jgi:hypothetical protein
MEKKFTGPIRSVIVKLTSDDEASTQRSSDD